MNWGYDIDIRLQHADTNRDADSLKLSVRILKDLSLVLI